MKKSSTYEIGCPVSDDELLHGEIDGSPSRR